MLQAIVHHIGPMSKIETARVVVSALVARTWSVLTRLKTYVRPWYSAATHLGAIVDRLSGHLDMRSVGREILGMDNGPNRPLGLHCWVKI